MSLLPDDQNFDRRWLNEHTAEVNISTIKNLVEIREFAYKSFDLLDKDGNGFIETNELEEAMRSDRLGNRERSFIVFLLNNQEQIAEMHDEGSGPRQGISREDLDDYFKLLSELL